MKAFSVSSKDLFDPKKNPKLSLSVKDILKNKKIKKTPINRGDKKMTALPVIWNYGKYSSSNYGAHTLAVTIRNLEVYFSYKTPVAFMTPKTGLVCSENIWGNTTGKHLNWIEPDKKQRVKSEEFEKQFAEILKPLEV